MTPFLFIIGLVVAALLWPAKWDPAILIKERQIKAGTHPESPQTDEEWINTSHCPDCHEQTLLEGPSGGMSMNVACNTCLMEFNVHHSFSGVLKVDRTGKLSESRARVFGIKRI